MSPKTKIDSDYVKDKVGKGLQTMFEMYSWEQMINDCELTPKEKMWAKLNLTYQVVELDKLYLHPLKQQPLKEKIHQGLKHCGYSEDALLWIEEELTSLEYHWAKSFIVWLINTDTTIGKNNYDDIVDLYLRSLMSDKIIVELNKGNVDGKA